MPRYCDPPPISKVYLLGIWKGNKEAHNIFENSSLDSSTPTKLQSHLYKMPLLLRNTTILQSTQSQSEKTNNLDELVSIVGILLAGATLMVAFLHFHQKPSSADATSARTQSALLYISILTSIADDIVDLEIQSSDTIVQTAIENRHR